MQKRSAFRLPKPMTGRPALPKATPEMRRWAATLGEELATWPGVASRPMFGLQAFYRGGAIFAALPNTRAAESPTSLLIKLPGVQHARLRSASRPGAGWLTYAMESDADIADALRWLGRAYEKAGQKNNTRSSR